MYDIRMIIAGTYQNLEIRAAMPAAPSEEAWWELFHAITEITEHWNEDPTESVCSGHRLQLSGGGVAEIHTRYTVPPMRR